MLPTLCDIDWTMRHSFALLLEHANLSDEGYHVSERLASIEAECREIALQRRSIERRTRDLIKRNLTEGINLMLAGDVDGGKESIRSAIKASGGFLALANEIGIPEKSLIRMFGSGGNPQAKNLFAVIAYLQKRHRFRISVK